MNEDFAKSCKGGPSWPPLFDLSSPAAEREAATEDRSYELSGFFRDIPHLVNTEC